VSRSFGDLQFKKKGMIATPDVHAFELIPRDHFLLLGCDGFWGVFSPNDAMDLTASLLEQGRDMKSITNRLVHEVRVSPIQQISY
jgi:integrin-linked kinase-associated serine/threonine phosphatase 2C